MTPSTRYIRKLLCELRHTQHRDDIHTQHMYVVGFVNGVWFSGGVDGMAQNILIDLASNAAAMRRAELRA